MLQLCRAHGQRVSAGNQYVPYLLVRTDILHGSLQRGFRDGQILFAYDAAARAVAAVHGALHGHEQQHAVRIAMHHVGDWAVRHFAQRIGKVVCVRPRFEDGRNGLHANRVVGIARVDQRCVVRRNRHAKRTEAGVDLVFLLPGERENLLELIGRGDAVAKLPFPVVPVLFIHA